MASDYFHIDPCHHAFLYAQPLSLAALELCAIKHYKCVCVCVCGNSWLQTQPRLVAHCTTKALWSCRRPLYHCRFPHKIFCSCTIQGQTASTIWSNLCVCIGARYFLGYMPLRDKRITIIDHTYCSYLFLGPLFPNISLISWSIYHISWIGGQMKMPCNCLIWYQSNWLFRCISVRGIDGPQKIGTLLIIRWICLLLVENFPIPNSNIFLSKWFHFILNDICLSDQSIYKMNRVSQWKLVDVIPLEVIERFTVLP